MVLNKKIFAIILCILVFAVVLYIAPSVKITCVKEVVSPVNIVLEDGRIVRFNEYDTFDTNYSEKNSNLAKALGITEDEAFILGNFGKYWAKNTLFKKRTCYTGKDLVYNRFGYIKRFKNSPYALASDKPISEKAFLRELNSIRKGKFVIVDLDTDNVLPISKENVPKNFVVVRRSHIKTKPKETIQTHNENKTAKVLDLSDIKIILSDSTSKLVPDRNCSSDACREILKNIEKTQNTLDMAIYGYSSTPKIEKAIQSAISRGVKIRLVYDVDLQGENIYPDTNKFVKLIPNNRNDNSKGTMHNKFYIFDNKVVITGSANLSHTDMSGYNSNSVVVINSPEAAKIYTREFEQMYSGKFQDNKVSAPDKKVGNLEIFFSPQDKGIQNGILPIIKSAKRYIYVPAFVITERNFVQELINAKNRGVDVKIIADALNASAKHSKHRELRDAGIQLKAENYAGKMHSKSMIIDDEYVIIGSMNFSYSGENRNDENTVIIKSPKMAKFYKEFFLYQWNKIPDRWLKSVPRAEGKDSIGSCSDGIDNNYDGFTDSDDTACR